MFQWDSANIEHITRHGVTQKEAEQVIANDPVELSQERRNGESRVNHLGETNEGRVLLVVLTERGGLDRVVTAFPVKRKLRDAYQTFKAKRTAARPANSGLQD